VPVPLLAYFGAAETPILSALSCLHACAYRRLSAGILFTCFYFFKEMDDLLDKLCDDFEKHLMEQAEA